MVRNALPEENVKSISMWHIKNLGTKTTSATKRPLSKSTVERKPSWRIRYKKSASAPQLEDTGKDSEKVQKMSTSTCTTPRTSTSSTEYVPYIDIDEHYTLVRELGTGTYGRVILAVCKETGTNIALKKLPKSTTKYKDFEREFSYSYFLSPHRGIIDTFEVAFETADHYVFAQELAPCGDLFEAIQPQVGLTEVVTKTVIRQLTSALEFMHSKELVHRDVKPENILLFERDMTRIKLMDFGMTRKVGTMVRKTSSCIPYTPPEICEALKNERYSVETSTDVWALGVLIFCIMTGNFPWELATQKDGYYTDFCHWQKRKSVKVPPNWKCFSNRFMRLMRRLLEPNPDKRSDVREVHKYIEDHWIHECKNVNLDDLMCPLVHAESSNAAQIDELTEVLEACGVDTKINKKERDRRVHDWLLST